MTKQANSDWAGISLVIAVATAVAGYLPATYLYDGVTRWLSPVRHAEEAMGRGLEVLLIGGPVGALCLGAIAGIFTYRSRRRHAIPVAVAFIAGCAFASFAVARWTNLL